MYDTEPITTLIMIILLVFVPLALFAFHTTMRKWLKVEEHNFFSYNHVNQKHKRIDWTIRVIAMVGMLLSLPVYLSSDFTYWFLQSWIIMILFLIISEIVRAVMERKYAENPNAYKLTIIQLLFTLLLIFVLFQFLGLFEI